MLTLLPGILLNLLIAALKSFGVDVPLSISGLVTQLEPVVEKLIADIRSGGTPSAETVSILQDLLPAIQAVKNDTSLDPKYMEWANLLDAMVVNIILADKDAQTGVDPTKLHVE